MLATGPRQDDVSLTEQMTEYPSSGGIKLHLFGVDPFKVADQVLDKDEVKTLDAVVACVAERGE